MGMIIMQLKRKIGLIAAGLITLSGVSIIEEIYVYGNEKNKSNIVKKKYIYVNNYVKSMWMKSLQSTTMRFRPLSWL